MGKRAEVGDKRRRKDGHTWEKLPNGKWKKVAKKVSEDSSIEVRGDRSKGVSPVSPAEKRDPTLLRQASREQARAAIRRRQEEKKRGPEPPALQRSRTGAHITPEDRRRHNRVRSVLEAVEKEPGKPIRPRGDYGKAEVKESLLDLEKSGTVKPTKDGKGYELTPKGKEWVERRRSEENVIREKRGQKPKLSPEEEQRRRKEEEAEAPEPRKVTSPEEIGSMLAEKQKKLDEKRKVRRKLSEEEKKKRKREWAKRQRKLGKEKPTAAKSPKGSPDEVMGGLGKLGRLKVVEDPARAPGRRNKNVFSEDVFENPEEGLVIGMKRSDEKKYTEREIPLSKLVPTQELIPKMGLAAYMNNPPGELPEVFEVVNRPGSEGKMYIHSGHTRMGSQKLMGRDTAKAKVFKWDAGSGEWIEPL